MEVQVFGVKKNADTRKALRFFAERRVRTHFVDFKVRSPSVGELRRFAQKFGVEQLVDQDTKAYRARGLYVAQLHEARWLEELSENPLLVRMPLVRYRGRLTIGPAEHEWREWLSGG